MYSGAPAPVAADGVVDDGGVSSVGVAEVCGLAADCKVDVGAVDPVFLEGSSDVTLGGRSVSGNGVD